MKKRLLMMATILVGLGLASCSADSSGVKEAADKMEKELNEKVDKIGQEIDENVESNKGDISYQCPVDCDNGPVYSEAGPCNKCGKDMVVF